MGRRPIDGCNGMGVVVGLFQGLIWSLGVGWWGLCVQEGIIWG